MNSRKILLQYGMFCERRWKVFTSTETVNDWKFPPLSANLQSKRLPKPLNNEGDVSHSWNLTACMES